MIIIRWRSQSHGLARLGVVYGISAIRESRLMLLLVSTIEKVEPDAGKLNVTKVGDECRPFGPTVTWRPVTLP